MIQSKPIYIISCLLLLFSCLAVASPAPDAQQAAGRKRDTPEPLKPSLEKYGFGTIELLPVEEDPTAIEFDKRAALEARSAGLAWKIQEGPVKVFLTNPHTGYAGPKVGTAYHTNFHVALKNSKGTFVDKVNVHITPYHHGGKHCWYLWESHSKKVLLDSCFDNPVSSVTAAVKAVFALASDIIHKANFLEAVLIIGAATVALIALLDTVGAAALVLVL